MMQWAIALMVVSWIGIFLTLSEVNVVFHSMSWIGFFFSFLWMLSIICKEPKSSKKESKK